MEQNQKKESRGKLLAQLFVSFAKIGVMTFLGVMLLPFIPGVGSIAYLVILFYWSFAAGIDGTRKSFARATLIFTAIMVVVVMMVAGMLLAAWPELAEMGGL